MTYSRKIGQDWTVPKVNIRRNLVCVMKLANDFRHWCCTGNYFFYDFKRIVCLILSPLFVYCLGSNIYGNANKILQKICGMEQYAHGSWFYKGQTIFEISTQKFPLLFKNTDIAVSVS